jgi:hypothetical protein
MTRFAAATVPLLILATGTLAPASAQVDFAGQWAPLYHEDTIERIPGPELGDYTGLPLNDAGRLRADSWDADRISVVQEYQCRPHSADYSLRGLAPLRVTTDYDPATQRIVAFHTFIGAYENQRTIYLDGRDHPPPYAAQQPSAAQMRGRESREIIESEGGRRVAYHKRRGRPPAKQASRNVSRRSGRIVKNV